MSEKKSQFTNGMSGYVRVPPPQPAPAVPSGEEEARACNHWRKIGTVGCIINSHNEIGVWRWLFCEDCGSFKQWDAESQTDKEVEWTLPRHAAHLRQQERERICNDIMNKWDTWRGFDIAAAIRSGE